MKTIVAATSSGLIAAVLAVWTASTVIAQTSDLVQKSALRVCADPANLPFSNEDRKGFENEIANLLGRKLDLPVTYEWFPQATGFVRQTLRAGKCDIIMGYAQGHELVQNTNHYYRSSYVMVVKSGGKLDSIEKLDDPRLKSSRIGVIAGTPPATILAMNALLLNVKPYNLTVDRRHESPAGDMIRDLLSDKVDVAILWGPIGGSLVKQNGGSLKVVPLSKETRGPRMAYRTTFGIRPGEPDWKHLLNDFIATNQNEINRILLSHGVPLLDEKNRLIRQ